MQGVCRPAGRPGGTELAEHENGLHVAVGARCVARNAAGPNGPKEKTDDAFRVTASFRPGYPLTRSSADR